MSVPVRFQIACSRETATRLNKATAQINPPHLFHFIGRFLPYVLSCRLASIIAGEILIKVELVMFTQVETLSKVKLVTWSLAEDLWCRSPSSQSCSDTGQRTEPKCFWQGRVFDQGQASHCVTVRGSLEQVTKQADGVLTVDHVYGRVKYLMKVKLVMF